VKKEAKEKIKQEIEANKDNRYINYIGTYLLGYLEKHEDFAEHVLKNKTISESIDAMRAEAKKHQDQGVALISDVEGFQIVVDYFSDDDLSQTDVKESVEETTDRETEGVSDPSEPELFTRNAWYADAENNVFYAYKKGDEKPREVVNRTYKTATKKQYEEWLEAQADLDDDLGLDDPSDDDFDLDDLL